MEEGKLAVTIIVNLLGQTADGWLETPNSWQYVETA
jgi:hypothetical protein